MLEKVSNNVFFMVAYNHEGYSFFFQLHSCWSRKLQVHCTIIVDNFEVINYLLSFPTADKKKLELAEKFKKLKSSGKLDQYLKKKGKKVASKERKKMPQRRVVETWKHFERYFKLSNKSVIEWHINGYRCMKKHQVTVSDVGSEALSLFNIVSQDSTHLLNIEQFHLDLQVVTMFALVVTQKNLK